MLAIIESFLSCYDIVGTECGLKAAHQESSDVLKSGCYKAFIGIQGNDGLPCFIEPLGLFRQEVSDGIAVFAGAAGSDIFKFRGHAAAGAEALEAGIEGT